MSYVSYYNKYIDIDDLVGETIELIQGLEKESDEVRIFTKSGKEILFFHEQSCCEHVRLCDFEVGTDDFSGALIVSAEVVSEEGETGEWGDSQTWTFYKIETTKGEIWMRWLGESNGYYSESVDIVWANKPDAEP